MFLHTTRRHTAYQDAHAAADPAIIELIFIQYSVAAATATRFGASSPTRTGNVLLLLSLNYPYIPDTNIDLYHWTGIGDRRRRPRCMAVRRRGDNSDAATNHTGAQAQDIGRCPLARTSSVHANSVRKYAEEYVMRRQNQAGKYSKSAATIATSVLKLSSVRSFPGAKAGTFFARDNVSNFISWCRRGLGVFECLLFETDDLIMRKNEKHVILCLLEVARRGAKLDGLSVYDHKTRARVDLRKRNIPLI
ncbi:cytoskeletal adaptor activity protein [Homalodisca vitripennis]|nr:cytoskeletal adaptor activity protein [Homalodisca vitripennis]